ncbi:MAG: YhgE/Pip family protein, partial [Clostridia bacterium]|nr:YhgE/Pip family protein [Clostridia bacterium]
MSERKRTVFLKIFVAGALLVVMLIPSIYACIFLGSMWDPYGNINELPVAVVNHDKPVKYQGKKLSIGNDLVDKLKKNDSLKFSFVDEKTAQEGIENGTYYMVITIPEDFSENSTTLMTDNPKKMDLNYATNPGKNYIASKMSSTALERICREIESSVTESYTQSVFDEIGNIAKSLRSAADGANKIESGVKQLEDGNGKITDNLKLLSDSTVKLKDGAVTLDSGIKTYTDGVAEVNSGVWQLTGGLRNLDGSVPALSSGVQSLL